jgi:phage tail P2-like protein
MSAWSEGRPIFLRLPLYGWQDNAIADAITEPYDRSLIELKEAILNFPRDFIDPDTCRSDALDWLAQLMGFTGDYWDTNWPDSIKRQLIKDAQFIWSYKGTQQLLEYLLALFALDAVISIPGAWRVGITAIGNTIGGDLLTYSILINSAGKAFYLRTSDEWRLIERLNRLFMPCWCSPTTLNSAFVHYDRFRVGLSAVGEPI